MLENIIVFKQSSIKISKDLIIYFDPFKMEKYFNDADIIFITHDHYDHFDVESINKVRKDSTTIVIPNTIKDKVSGLFNDDNIVVVQPNNSYVIKNINVETIPSYNINKQFHPKDNNWVGYVVTLDGIRYYAMGDTDDTLEARNVSCDVLFIPIGGTYTMDKYEASKLTNYLKPKVVVPIHYGEVVGNYSDGEEFSKLIDSSIKCEILIK